MRFAEYLPSTKEHLSNLSLKYITIYDRCIVTFCEDKWIIPLATSIASFTSFLFVNVDAWFMHNWKLSFVSTRLFIKNFRKCPPEQYSVTTSIGSKKEIQYLFNYLFKYSLRNIVIISNFNDLQKWYHAHYVVHVCR